MIEMKVKYIAIEQETKSPVMVLTDAEEKRFLPIWIGPFEAQSIAQVLEGVSSPRPMTHDLIRNIIEQFGSKVRRIVVNDIQDQTFYARIILENEGRETEIDARPSDSVAIALRFKAPIFVAEGVIQSASVVDKDKAAKDKKQFKEFVDRISADMFTEEAISTKPETPQKPPEPGEET